jgi:hypothetical protein
MLTTSNRWIPSLTKQFAQRALMRSPEHGATSLVATCVPRGGACSIFAALLIGCSHTPQPESTTLSSLSPPAFRLTSVGEGLPRTGQWRSQIAVADMDGDGRPDLVLPPPRKLDGRPRVFLSSSDGSWRSWSALRLPPTRLDYGGIAALDFTGDGRLDLAFGMHLRGLAAFGQGATSGEMIDLSTGLTERPDGNPSKASSQSVTAVPATRGSTAALAVIYETLNERDTPGAAVWRYSGQKWHSRRVSGAQRGSHSQWASDGVAYLGNASLIHFDAYAEQPIARRVADLGENAHGHAFAMSPEGTAYVALSQYRNDAWERRIDFLPRALNHADNNPKSLLRSPILRTKGVAFTAVAATSAAPWSLAGELLAVGDDVGNLQIYIVQASAHFTLVGEFPVSAWRHRCPVSNLVWAPLAKDQPPRLIATFSGEISVYDFEGGCRNFGGVDAFAVERSSPLR